MTQTNPSRDRRPTDILINLLVTLLAPMFLAAADGDVVFARIAAVETITEYRAHSQASLIRVANIIAFGIATLASLSQSMQDDVPIPLALRLRGNANALDRSAARNERALRASRPSVAPEPAAAEPPAAQTVPAAPANDQAYRNMWATAMAEVAAEETAALGSLPPAERKDMSMRIAALNTAASELMSGASAPRPNPGDLAWMTQPMER
jgi:hypothetical protein